ncbi:MAG: protein phosphatase 2C domain-containing protein [Gammaproteobacteria bacterium]|nr:protein phosphatase 2C domain-containing protein [Gammaproteobacteria bacterium]MBU1654024.1 protein phosphatase 2C domain-containing protein [Gammaproteobacteria bacterium]MBU1959693.1 protein phosphatase 2C domain-containing protein [Gammaproteobacteria bacterium]
MLGLRLPLLTYPRAQAAARSEQGPRAENQDNYLLIDGSGEAAWLHDGRERRERLPHWPRDHWRLCVIDGMGGHQGGRAFAAEVADALRREPFSPRAEAQRRERLLALHQRLYDRHHSSPESPGSTLIWIDIRPDGTLHLLHVGDSRAWHWRDGIWQPLTQDHTEAEFLERDGDPPRDGAPEHAIAQALGYGSFGLLRDADGDKPARAAPGLRLDLARELPSEHQARADLRGLRLRRGDRLLLATDGIWSNGIDPVAGLAPGRRAERCHPRGRRPAPTPLAGPRSRG